jgi:hypothetical protein
MTCGNCGNDGSEQFFAHVSDQRVYCIVRYCSNTKGEGRFDGPVCSPCANALRGEREPPAASRILKSIWPYRGLEEA